MTFCLAYEPFPDKLTVCGPGALSVIATLAVRLPVAVGLQVTLILQLAPAATLLPQVFFSVKSPGLTPVKAMFAIVMGALPVLVSVTL